MDTIILYDIPSRSRLHSWSLNTLKARLVLNYKKVEYVTMWTEYPEIAPTFKNAGILPNKEGMPYTCPVIRFPRSPTSEPRWVMDSHAIATALEQEFPSPPLHLDHPILPQVMATMSKAAMALAPVFIPRVLRDILNPRSIPYFTRTREDRFGMSMDELEKSEKGGDKAWENAAPHLSELAGLLKENGGPFLMGKTVSFADFVVLALLQMLKRISYDGDAFDRVVQTDPSFPVLYEACAEWLKRDDY